MLHAVDRYWCVAEALGAGASAKRFLLPVDEACRAWARRLLRDYPRPWLAVGVGARWLTKRWPPAHFASLTQRVLDTFGGTAVFVGAPDEAALGAEAVKIGLIVVLLWVILTNYGDVVVAAFLGTFLATALIFAMAFFVRDA